MREINVILEGYSLRGLCLCCLNYSRKMLHRERTIECYKFLGELTIPEGLTIQLCYECDAILQKIYSFQQQINNAYQILADYASKQAFLSSPNDFNESATQRLKMSNLEQCECGAVALDRGAGVEQIVPVIDDLNNSEIDIKTENITNINLLEIEKSDFSYTDDEIRLKEENVSFEEETFSENNDILHEDKKSDFEGETLKVELVSEPVQPVKVQSEKKVKSSQRKTAPNKLKSLTRDFNPEAVQAIQASKEEIVQIRQSDVQDPLFLETPHRCIKCFAVFKSAAGLSLHSLRKHETTQYASCDICHIELMSRKHVQSHIKSHLFYLKCNTCEYKTTMNDIMTSHLIQHEELKGGSEIYWSKFKCDKELNKKAKEKQDKSLSDVIYECDICHYKTRYKNNLKHHIQRHDTTIVPVKFECPKCNRKFSRKYAMKQHLRLFHEESSALHTCEYCGKTMKYATNLSRHVRTHIEKNKNMAYECKLCNMKTFSRQCYQRHIKYGKKHREANAYQCDYCGKGFRDKVGCTRHIRRLHLNEGSRSCSECDKVCAGEIALYYHMRTAHKNERIYCDICGKIFTGKQRLRYHIESYHSADFDCEVCHKVFKTRMSLNIHKQIHDERKINTCHVCGKRFLYYNNLSRHIKYVHTTTKKTVPCDICNKLFKSVDERKAHIKHVHMKEPWPRRNRSSKKNIRESNDKVSNTIDGGDQ